MRAAATHIESQGNIGALPGTRRARVSFARSLVPITNPERRVSESRASAAIERILNIASGVSIIAQIRVLRSVPISSRRRPMSSSVSGLDTFGTRMTSGAARAAADRSSACQGLSTPLMRMNTSRPPKPPAFTASAACLRAVSLASGATESSRSTITPSTGNVFAFSSARTFEPGI
jgi:hypothetical protein